MYNLSKREDKRTLSATATWLCLKCNFICPFENVWQQGLLTKMRNPSSMRPFVRQCSLKTNATRRIRNFIEIAYRDYGMTCCTLRQHILIFLPVISDFSLSSIFSKVFRYSTHLRSKNWLSSVCFWESEAHFETWLHLARRDVVLKLQNSFKMVIAFTQIQTQPRNEYRASEFIQQLHYGH